MKIKLFGINIYISVFFCALIAFLLIIDTTGFMSLSLIAILIHESGHFVCMQKVGCTTRKIEMTLYGIIVTGSPFKTVKEETLIAFFGPMFNLIAAVAAYCIGFLFENRYFYMFSMVNFAIGSINMLPVTGLDGGTVTYGIIRTMLKEHTAELLCFWISIITIAVLIFFGVWVVFCKIPNPSVLLFAVYLLILNILKQ
ncbi:MAG: hypothetical protein Q4B04_02195 [bacterium]|nr:hypothetical protein [bacterium]